jgi:hypothetical protein
MTYFAAQFRQLSLALIIFACTSADAVTLTFDWNKVVALSKANMSIQVCAFPPMRRESAIHDPLFNALHDLDADYARFHGWYPTPKLVVAELRPPESGKTFWDFSLLDPLVEDFMNATNGRTVIFSLGAIPNWVFEGGDPGKYSENPDELSWSYYIHGPVGKNSAKLFAEYQARLVGWYTAGGFKDELGIWHASGHHYEIEYWEVSNEPDDHFLTPEEYVQFYDATVNAVREVSPTMKFAGPALGGATTDRPRYLFYFMDRKNHAPGIPIDMVTYHFYSLGVSDETSETMTHTMFEQADRLLTAARYIESMRLLLAPQTRTAVDELGSTLPGVLASPPMKAIPRMYWNLAGAMLAYGYANLASIGVDVVNSAELIDYPGNFASSTLVSWVDGRPNARYWVTRLLRENFGPGDRLLEPLRIDEALGADPKVAVFAQGFVAQSGQRKVLLVNKRLRPVELTLPGSAGGTQQVVDDRTVAAPKKKPHDSNFIKLRGLAVAVITLP